MKWKKSEPGMHRLKVQIESFYTSNHADWEFFAYKLSTHWYCDAQHISKGTVNCVVKGPTLRLVKQLLDEKVKLGKFTQDGDYLV